MEPMQNPQAHQAYRLLRTPDVAVDIYADNAVIHLFGSAPDHATLEASLKKQLPALTDFFYKDRRGKGAGKPLPAPHKEIVIEENGHRFLINLSDYLDTGLFLDHRETRRWIQAQSKGKVVLNTFAYTGSFSIYAAAGGATKTHSVDLSKTYCDWTKKNIALNNLPPENHWVYKMDTMEFFAYAKRKGMTFDIIILDPPTFSKNKEEHFSVERDHPTLINTALDLLTPDGFILFSTNCTTFKMDRHRLSSDCTIQPLTGLTAPDFKGQFSHLAFVVRRANRFEV